MGLATVLNLQHNKQGDQSARRPKVQRFGMEAERVQTRSQEAAGAR